MKEYEDIIKTNKKNIIFFAYQQDEVFRKFKENRKLKNLVERFKITKRIIIYKINIVKLIDKDPKKMTSSITLKLFKKLSQRYYEHLQGKLRRF